MGLYNQAVWRDTNVSMYVFEASVVKYIDV